MEEQQKSNSLKQQIERKRKRSTERREGHDERIIHQNIIKTGADKPRQAREKSGCRGVHELTGSRLLCSCKPGQKCYGDNLVQLYKQVCPQTQHGRSNEVADVL